MRILLLAVTLLATITACNNQPAAEQAKNTGGTSAPVLKLDKPQYHRYTGSIAGTRVVVNLVIQPQKPGETGTGYFVSGNYYYTGKSRLLILSPMGERKQGDTIVLAESAESEANISADTRQNTWKFLLDNNGLHGTWIAANGTTTYPLQLTEQYEAGSYPLDVIASADSAVVSRKGGRNSMQAWFLLMTPNAQWKSDEATFVTKALLHEWQNDTAADMAAYMTQLKKNLFEEYSGMMKDSDGPGGDPIDDHSVSLQMDCVYNEHGLLVLATTNYAYTGGAHGNYGTQYTCLDVQEKRVWHMNDVVADTNAMPALLDAAAREYYNMKPGQKLSDFLFTDVIKPADNISVSDAGITFHYTPYEIAPYAAGEIALCVPYSKINPYLAPGFRKRIGK